MEQEPCSGGLRTEGTNFRVLGNQVRTETAKCLLKDEAWSVQDVATYLGYESAQNFSRAFRSSCGRPPSSFARM
ncbi:helix-turn-helix domain-containing protein [Halocynthiibacter halioticoli]|uniref:helix-turn-helix domain-containing protein n=1 Tax=Halocynthiibacter TaxID=1579315 RepID=UPI0037437C2E